MAEGVLNINKPLGMTSHDVVNRIRRITGIRRVGHTGTLDPLATGVLLICIGRAARLSEYLVGQDKRYRAVIRLGLETDSYDGEGLVVSEHPVEVDLGDIEQALEQFKGTIQQQAPAYSAVKVGGEALYKKARRGEVSERPVREVTIHEMEILNWSKPLLELELHCSSGTYIRSVAHNLGQSLGCGGSLDGLKRTSVGSFLLDESVELDELDPVSWEESLLPMDCAVAHLPRMVVTAEEAVKLHQGQSLPSPEETIDDSLVRVYDDMNTFVGVAASSTGRLKAKKILYDPQPRS